MIIVAKEDETEIGNTLATRWNNTPQNLSYPNTFFGVPFRAASKQFPLHNKTMNRTGGKSRKFPNCIVCGRECWTRKAKYCKEHSISKSGKKKTVINNVS